MDDNSLGNTARAEPIGPDIPVQAGHGVDTVNELLDPNLYTGQHEIYHRAKPELVVVGRDLTTGRFAPVRNIPITENNMSDFDPTDAAKVGSFFQYIANQVVNASQLAVEVEELRKVVEGLKRDVEDYRENNRRLDEEVSHLRAERVDLQRENAQIRAENATQATQITSLEAQLSSTREERDRWQSNYIQGCDALTTTQRERDDAQLQVMQLEERLRQVEQDRDNWKTQSDDDRERLANVRMALERTRQPFAA